MRIILAELVACNIDVLATLCYRLYDAPLDRDTRAIKQTKSEIPRRE